MSAEKDFIDLMKEIKIKIDFNKYPDSIFFFKDNKYIFEAIIDTHSVNELLINLRFGDKKDVSVLNFCNTMIWCSELRFLDVFEKKHKMSTEEINNFLKNMFNKHFHLNMNKLVYDDDLKWHYEEKHFECLPETLYLQ